MGYPSHPVVPPKIVAIATDKYLTPKNSSVDPDLPAPAPKYGQDFTFGVGRAAPGGKDVGTTEADLKPKMRGLLSIFADDDKSGMATRLFDKFLAKQKRVYYFGDADLNAAAAAHENIQHFCAAALGAPHPWGIAPAPGKTRIHQALKAAGWDVTKLIAPTDLGVPAFNTGSKFHQTGDFANGLGLMINGVQHVYTIATHYHYEKINNWYSIKLKYILYDVFGLDDDDLDEYGARTDTTPRPPRTGNTRVDKDIEAHYQRMANRRMPRADVGITAWWQLQHQHGYAPLVTRIVVEKSHYVPAT